MWIDSHTHLNDQAFHEDYHQVIENAINNGVSTMVVVGYDLDSSRRAVELADSYPMLWAAVGIHPQDACTWDQEVAHSLEELLKKPKVIALGEIGLDYHYLDSENRDSPKKDQHRAFLEQLQLAKEYNKPVIIHNREAHQDTFSLINEVRLGSAGGVMHCFSGSREMASQFLNMGLYLSFTGVITFTNAEKLRNVVAEVPLNRLLVETDCPYLSPNPFRGRRNEPCRVVTVGQKIAEIKHLPDEAVMEATMANAKSLFQISKG
jgi:TatD DNase family protein